MKRRAVNFMFVFALGFLVQFQLNLDAGEEEPELGDKVEVVEKAGSDWGTLKGRIEIKGEVPDPQTFPTNSRFKQKCKMKKDRTVQRVKVKDSGVQNVFVRLKGVTKALESKLPPKTIVVDQKKCRFRPRAGLVQANGTIKVKNSDPTIHNFNYSGSNPLGISGNKTQPKGADPIKVHVKSPEYVSFRCNVHPWMKGRVLVADHHAYALTDKKGKFSMKVPPGSYQMEINHLSLKKPKTVEVEVPENDTKKKTVKVKFNQ